MKDKLMYFIIAGLFILLCIISIMLANLIFTKNNKQSSNNLINETGEIKITENLEENSTLIIGNKKLIFIHHSTGENWLADDNGGLGIALKDNGYFVSDTNYGWGSDSIGDKTDIGHWWTWFRSSKSEEYLTALYNENGQNSDYSRLLEEPQGENEIILIKSCFPNSNIIGQIDETAPCICSNQLKGNDSSSEYHTVGNIKGIYKDLLNYFQTKQDKLFIIITAPPLSENNTTSEAAANARAVNNWLKYEWLKDYPYKNVAVFDLFNILTNNGQSNYSQYSTDLSDDHPNKEGNQKATEEFINFLNTAYNQWNKE